MYSLYLVWFCTLSVIFSHNNSNNNNLQISIILKNEAIGLESLAHIFGTAHMHFSGFIAIPESNYLVPNQSGTIGINRGCWIGLCLRLKKKCHGQWRCWMWWSDLFLLSYLQCTNNLSSMIRWITCVHDVRRQWC